MRIAIVTALAFCGLLLQAAAARAAEQNLGLYLVDCQAHEPKCLSEIAADIDAGGQMGEVCFPAAESFQDGAKQSLDWLRKNAAATLHFAQSPKENALQTSFGRLWPCTDH